MDSCFFLNLQLYVFLVEMYSMIIKEKSVFWCQDEGLLWSSSICNGLTGISVQKAKRETLNLDSAIIALLSL